MRLGALGYGCRLREEQLQLFQAYLELLYRWNRAYNLTAVPVERALAYHLLDSLSILPFLAGNRLLDAGSGAGLPGLPLAIAGRQLRVTLCDSNGKRCRFLHQVLTELGLGNVEVFAGRAERLSHASGFTSIVARGYARLADLVAHTRHLLAPGGIWLAMKGRVRGAELAALDEDVRVENCVNLQVDGIDGCRSLILMRPACSS